MDGFAVRSDDLTAERRIIGISAAGHAFKGKLKPGEAVRIFTGAPVPSTADAIVIQENTTAAGEIVTIISPARAQQHIRQRGLDFGRADHCPRVHYLNARDIGSAAAIIAASSAYG
jgi:molybdopterin molybdotransferase